MTIANMHPERWRKIDELFHAFFEMTPNSRSGFLEGACGGDASLRAEIEKLIDGSDQAGRFIETPPVLDETTIALSDLETEPVAGFRLGAYNVIREIGRGGMGTVYLAARADEEFQKRVAIKLVTAGFDHESIIQRFRNERQILAGLDHPNIARLLDGGTTENGAPYFVMEYIEGQTIRDYCDTHRLTTIERLKLFRTVCSAVHFAHQNLIVHRDIKPGNILVTEGGTPKLLDFGVAKLLSPTAQAGDVTEVTSRMMTPEYASPEQARGEIITTASDVYSLGVLLYELLTGHRPYRVSSRSMMEIIEAICEEQPTKPSTVIGRTETSPGAGGNTELTVTPEAVSKARDSEPNRLRRELQGDLDNIVLKAVRKEPRRRYASVEQFSEDIQRYFEHLPVIACQDTVSYRTGKFIVRHKAGVAALLIIALTLLSATIATGWQARVARLGRARAERRFGEIRKLSNSLITEVQSSLTTIPGTAPTQRLLAQKALDYLDSLAQDEDRDVGVLGELASAYLNVGSLQAWTLFDNAGALQSYQKAVAIQRQRILLAPNDVTTKKDLGFGLFKLSEALAGLSRQEELFQACDEIIELYKALLTSDPVNQKLLSELAGSYERRGDLLRAFKRNEEAKADFHSALVSIKQGINLGKEIAVDPHARVSLSFDYLQQGVVFNDLGEWRDAVESYQIGGQIAEDVYRENPGLTQAVRFVSLSHNQVGDALDTHGDYRGALENYRYALKAVTEARAGNPNSSELRYSEAKDTVKVGIALHKVGQVSDSFELVRKGISLSREYIAEDRGRAATITYGTELFQQGADFLGSKGRPEEAIAVYQEALKILERSAAETIQDSGFRNLMARYEAAVGDLYASFDSETKTIKATSKAALLKARNRYQQSLDILQSEQKQGVVFSDLADRLEEVSQKLSACETALAKLKS